MNGAVLTPDLDMARRHLLLLDEDAETFVFQTFDDLKKRKDTSLAHVLHGTLDEHKAELTRLQARGAGVFVTVNRSKNGGRTKEDISAYRSFWREADEPNLPALPIEPHFVIETSPGKKHEYILIEHSEDLDTCDGIMERMVEDYGSDQWAKDRARVLRLAGFYHLKNPAKPHLVKIIHEGGGLPYTLEKVSAAIPPLQKSTKAAPPVNGEIKNHTRNASLFSLAGSMRQRGMEPSEILPALLEVNRRCVPPLEKSEVEQIAYGIGRYEPAKHEVEVKPKQAGPSMTMTSLSDLYAEPEAEVEYIVDGVLPTGGISASVAKPKVGKSTLVRQMALAVSTGAPFLGKATKQGAVLYLALEEKRSEVKKHFQDMGATGTEPIYIYVGGAGPDALIQLEEVIKEKKPVLVIADPLFRLIKVKDGNDYAQMSAGLDPILRLARDLGTHVHVVHHAPKGEKEDAGESPLGSTAIFGSIDTLMVLKRHPAEGYRTLQTIQRYGEDIPETLLKFDPVSRTTILGRSKGEEDMDGVRTRILSYFSEQKTPVGESVIEVDVLGRTALKRKALRELVSSGQIERHGKGGRKDPFTYSCSSVPDVLDVPDVPENETHGSKNLLQEPIQSSCFDVPAYGKNIRNNNHEKSQDNKNIEKSSCSHIPAKSSCSRESQAPEIVLEVLA